MKKAIIIVGPSVFEISSKTTTHTIFYCFVYCTLHVLTIILYQINKLHQQQQIIEKTQATSPTIQEQFNNKHVLINSVHIGCRVSILSNFFVQLSNITLSTKENV